MKPSSLFKLVAIGEAITWTLLLLGMVGKYAAGLDWATAVGGGIHGFVFLCYVATVITVAIDQRWSARTTAFGLGAAIIPYLTLVFEKHVEHHRHITDPWQLGAGERTPQGMADRLVAWAIGKPVQAVVVALVGIAVVFTILLALGNPKDLLTQ